MNLHSILHSVGWAGLFGLAYAQAPLYYSNQNQYFLHGLADARDGPLRADWLAGTATPAPAFDVLVSATARFGHEYAFHFYYAMLLGVYWFSLVGVSDFLAGGRAGPRRRLVFSALLMLAHSALLRWASYRLTGADYPCYFQGWLAAQYVLGPVFQPSTAGVFLIAGVLQSVRNRPLLAATCLGIACIGHSTYLLPAGLLTVAFAGLLASDGRRGKAFGVAALALLAVSPGLVHAYLTFGPTTPETFAEATRILVTVRIPHHCEPRRWCDAIAWVQLAWIGLSLALVWRTRLFPILGVLSSASLALTLVQLATDSRVLALLFPWRSSAILLPLATAIILSRLVRCAGRWIESDAAKWLSVAGVAVAVVGGIGIMATHEGFARNAAEEPLMAFVKATRRPGDLYLLPVSVPDLSAGRGSISSDFKPLPAQRGDGRVIPIDFQRFRLAADAPIYIDFKAIPYRDADVLEWHRRVRWNGGLYEDRDWNRTGAAAELKAAGITRVIAARDRDVLCDGLRLLYEDADYRLYAVGE